VPDRARRYCPSRCRKMRRLGGNPRSSVAEKGTQLKLAVSDLTDRVLAAHSLLGDLTEQFDAMADSLNPT
jgi:hypothetical protein